MIHAFGQIRREVRAFDLRADRARRAELKMRVLQALQAALIEIIGIVGGLIVSAVGTHQIASGSLTVGTLLAFVGTVGSLFGPLRSLAKASGRFQHAAAGADRVAQLLDVPSLVTEKTTARRLTAAKGQITFQNVGFAYPNGQRILQDISFSIEPDNAT